MLIDVYLISGLYSNDIKLDTTFMHIIECIKASDIGKPKYIRVWINIVLLIIRSFAPRRSSDLYLSMLSLASDNC